MAGKTCQVLRLGGQEGLYGKLDLGMRNYKRIKKSKRGYYNEKREDEKWKEESIV